MTKICISKHATGYYIYYHIYTTHYVYDIYIYSQIFIHIKSQKNKK